MLHVCSAKLQAMHAVQSSARLLAVSSCSPQLAHVLAPVPLPCLAAGMYAERASCKLEAVRPGSCHQTSLVPHLAYALPSCGCICA